MNTKYYCSECGCSDHPVKEERVPLKQRITKSKFWLGHHFDMFDDDEMAFILTFCITVGIAIFTAIISSEYLFPEEPKDYDLQFGVFFALISIISLCILLLMLIYNQGLRIVLKVATILISGIILLGSILLAIFYLSEIITDWIK